jgi:hypothetical protein
MIARRFPNWWRRNDESWTLHDRIISEAAGYFAGAKPDAAIRLLRELEFGTIDETTLRLTDPFLRPWIARGRQIVASFDPRRCPSADEIVIIYGNYPHMFENVVVNNPMKRHIASFWDLAHDRVEHDPRWDLVDQIYIINAATRTDRRDSVLRELGMARAPFDRIVILPAIVTGGLTRSRYVRGQMGCLASHIEVLQQALRARFDNILVLEDDFCFTSDIDGHLDDLSEFFARRYSYWICLLATLNTWRIVPQDDLVSRTLQPCTTTAAYLVSREGVEQLLPVQQAAMAELKATGDTNRYTADTYWSVLQGSGKFLVFRRKFGFQAASFSDIERLVTRYLY